MASTKCKPIPKLTDAEIEKFWDYVFVGAPDKCWPWRTRKSYGNFYIKRNGKTINLKTHRVAYFLGYGKDPLDKLVCHTCDYQPCCNYHHLFAGTTQDNMADMKSKGRGNGPRGDKQWTRIRPEDVVRGERHPKSKFTWEMVQKIRSEYRPQSITHGAVGLAKKYGVCQSSIHRIIIGQNWKKSGLKNS